MKNIYEDGGDRQKIEDISSGDFDFGDTDPLGKRPDRPVPPKVKSAVSRKQPTESESKNEPQQSQQQGENPLPFQLTQEQVTMLLSQYFMNQSAPQQQQQPEQSASEKESEEADDEPFSIQNPGTRILYQSPDFDKPEAVSEISDEERRNSFYDDDDFFEEKETVNRPPEIRRDKPKVSASNNNFKIDEVNISEVTVPLKKAKPVVYSSATGVKAITPKTAAKLPDGFAVEEIGDKEETTASENGEEKKKPDVKNIVRISVLTVSIIAIIIASAVLIKEYKLHKDNQNFESEISDLIIDEPTTKSGSKKDKQKQKLTIEQQWAQIRQEYPNTIFPQNIQLKYAKLYATNNDFVGYLEAKGVNLSLPIVQTTNDSTYLEKNFYGASTKYGCPFVSYVNNISYLDMNTIIWGHHMNDGTVFGALDAYKSIEGFKKAPVITFNTLYENYSWKVIAAFITNAYPEDDNNYVFEYYFSGLSSMERYSAYLNELSQRSLYDTGVDVLPTDKLLTLSTCSHEFDNARFVVVARLVRPGETTDVNVSAASVNPNPRFPQTYYTKKKLTNPYANSPQWEVG